MAEVFQPMDYSSGNGFLQGLNGAGLYQQVQQQRAQAEQAQQQQAAMQAFQQDWQKAYSSGDPQQLDAIVAKYPGQMETVQKAIGFRDDNHRMALGNTARDLRVAMQSGNPDAIAQVALRNASTLESIGSSPQEFMQMYQQDPKGAMQTVDTVGMGALGVKDYYGVQNDQQQRQIDRDKLAETVRSNQAGESLQGQQIAVSRENSIRSANTPTAAMQNYQQYAQLLKADPSSAATFAQAAGINPADKKLFKVETLPDGSLMKFYSDGTEEMAKSGDPIGQPGIKPISLPAAQSIIDKANEGSKKAAGFALRLKDSMDAMNNLSGTIDPKRIALINNALGNGTVANMSLSPAEQQYMVNARDALYSILRPETGAAITEGEMKEYSKMYLPQPGDSSKATETKMKKMNGQYKSLRGQSGRVYDALVVSSAANEGGGSPAMNQQPTTQQPVSGGGFSNLWGG
ncbi:phage DNA ejection protein [Yersinia vastinensis]|uniref:phage DNA ejection protein n=1 Tax=Yersinia vastinensis TaxID=2890318 RepID=UPI0005E6829D|nr:phage DNA ejection protein [Yersinia vastinensis]CNL11316.1 Uncharacterised protein [Yersinia frederiksenii]